MEKCKGFRDYVNKTRSLVAKLENVGAPMAREDQLLRFARGLAGHPQLYRAAKLTSRSLDDAIESATERYNSLVVQASVIGRAGPDELFRQRRKQGARLNVVAAAPEPEEEEWYEDGYGVEYEEEYGDEWEEEADLAAVQMRGVGRRGRGRGGRGPGRGRGHGQGGRDVRGGRGGGRAGRGGGRGRGRAPLTVQQRQWFDEGKCLLCGAADHFAAACPQRPGAGNA